MIFADSLPFAKPFFAAARLPDSTVGLLTRFVVACLNTLRSACQAADSIRTDPRHRAQLVRFLARQGWSDNWITLERLADVVLDACLHEQGDWRFLLDQTTHSTLGLHAQNTYSCRNTKRRKKNSNRKQKKTPPKLNHVFVCSILISPQTGTRIPCVRPYYTEEYCKQPTAKAKPGRPVPTFATQADIAADMIRRLRVPQGSRVIVLGDTAFEAKQIRKACVQRRFDFFSRAAGLEDVGPGGMEQVAQRELGLAERGVLVGDQLLGHLKTELFQPGGGVARQVPGPGLVARPTTGVGPWLPLRLFGWLLSEIAFPPASVQRIH